MAAGQLRELITVQRAGDTKDQYGNAQTGAWAAVTGLEDVPAQVRPARGQERVGAEGITATAMFEIRLRWTAAAAGIRINDRIIDARDASRVFNVKAPPLNYDQRTRFITIMAEAGGADG